MSSDEPEQPPAADAGAAGDGPDVVRAALARAREQARARGFATRQPRRPRRRTAPAPTADGSREPQLFGAVIRDLFAARGWEQAEKVGAVMGRWDALVGPDIAAHCRPESLRDGELVVVAESTAWATQLRLLERSLLTRLTAELGSGVVTRLRVHGPTTPDWRKGPRRVAGGRGPRDTYG